MSLAEGEQLHHFVISEPLGAGGMGEVYRARDTKLGRDVAIKILPAELAGDPDRLERFKREAKLLASLNHPNIAQIFEIELLADTKAKNTPGERLVHPACLVMELVEGSDLSHRIERGAISVKEATDIGRQIADGLDAAHSKGIIHRDLKPANIRINADGLVKILDFGLAKMWHPDEDDDAPSDAPTLSIQTKVGTILGTAPYMSPEQARGQTIDKRTDIWAFGCVCFEMLTGQRTFQGNSVAEVLAKVLEREPDWEALPSEIPNPLHRLLRRCLAKDPKDRYRDAGDISIALEDLEFEASSVTSNQKLGKAAFVPWLLAAVTTIIAIIIGTKLLPSSATLAPQALRFSEPVAAQIDLTVLSHCNPAVAISPDGQILAWVGVTNNVTQIFLRPLDQARARPVEGAKDALSPFFSPDSQWLGFWSDGKLRKVPVRGGTPQTICEIDHVHGVSWSEEMIVMGAIGDGSLFRVDLPDQQPRRIEITNNPSYSGGYPFLLPSSREVLVSSQGTNTVDLLSLETGEVRTLVPEGSNGTYLPTGHLLWVQADHLVIAPFDLDKHLITGEAQTLVEDIVTAGQSGLSAHYAVSATGTLIYLKGTTSLSWPQPSWLSFDGTIEPLPIAPQSSFFSPRISPDGKQLLYSTQANTKTNTFWLADLDRGVSRLVTDEAYHQFWATWTPDGKNMLYNSSEKNGYVNVWMQPVDQSQPRRRITNNEAIPVPHHVTRDNRFLIFVSNPSLSGNFDVHQIDLEERNGPIELLNSAANEIHPSLSPDNNWLAYASDVTGTFEVYLRRFPKMDIPTRVSSNGGIEPIWAPAGDRLFYRSENGQQIFSVDIITEHPLQLGPEQLLLEGRFVPGNNWGRKWDIHPTDEKFFVLNTLGAQSVEGVDVVINLMSTVTNQPNQN